MSDDLWHAGNDESNVSCSNRCSIENASVYGNCIIASHVKFVSVITYTPVFVPSDLSTFRTMPTQPLSLFFFWPHSDLVVVRLCAERLSWKITAHSGPKSFRNHCCRLLKHVTDQKDVHHSPAADLVFRWHQCSALLFGTRCTSCWWIPSNKPTPMEKLLPQNY